MRRRANFFSKFWNFGKTFSWHRHSICHVVLTTNPQFANISPGQFTRSNSWNYLWTNFLKVHWRCVQNITLQNLRGKKTPHFSKICPRELSFHTIHHYKKIHLVYYFKTIHCKLSISWNYSEINLSSSHNPKNQLPRLFKTVCNK